MSKRTREVWHCDVCGWEWLPDTNKVPERCPNRECRKRNWNQPEDMETVKRRIIEQMGADQFGPPQFHPPASGVALLHKLDALERHAVNCKCLICKPPKPQDRKSSS